MLSSRTHWTETPSLDTDDLFSFSMDEFTNQYEDLLDDEIFVSSEVKRNIEFKIETNSVQMFCR